MMWLSYDSDLDEPTRWDTIDPETGRPNNQVVTDCAHHHCLGVSAMDDVFEVGIEIAKKFPSRYWTDEVVSALIMERVVPLCFQGGPAKNAELLGQVDNLWGLAEKRYHRAIGRPPNVVERHWLAYLALAGIRCWGG